MSEIKDKLQHIQQNLNAPKNKQNTHSNFMYRSAEDILNALKPLLKETSTTLIISDDVLECGGRVYIKSTSELWDGKEMIGRSVGFAREAVSQKGMQDAQLTGSTSSYAKKYSLNGLFLIDDAQDPDSQDTTNSATFNKPQQNNAQNINWLSQDNFQSAMSCGNATKIQATIKAYSTPEKKMKKEYKLALENQIKTLGN